MGYPVVVMATVRTFTWLWSHLLLQG